MKYIIALSFSFVLASCAAKKNPNLTHNEDTKAPAASDKSEKPNVKITEAQSKIYSITQMTLNDAGCDTEGASVLDQQTSKFFVLKNVGDDHWGHFVYAVSCRDEASCQEALTTNTGGDWIWMFAQATSPMEFTGEQTHTGFFREGMCSKPLMKRLRLEFTNSKDVFMTSKTSFGADYPAVQQDPEKPPMCRTDIVREMLNDKPCEEYIVIRGTASTE